MSTLDHKIDFLAVISVEKANPNGDPLNGNRPRQDFEGYGEISDVAIKRKIRNRFIDMGEQVFVQSDDKKSENDKYNSLQERAEKEIPKDDRKDKEKYATFATKKWIDVRTFGQVFAFKKEKEEKEKGVSVGVRGPVSIHTATSIDPIVINSMQITKSVNSIPSTGKSPDTMGQKHFVDFAVYIIKGSINVQLAEKTGFTNEDAEKVKEALRTLFVNDASAARPDGSMEVEKLFWWEHNSKIGQYSSAQVHRSVKVEKNTDNPRSIDDYSIELEQLDGLKVTELIYGI